MLPEGKIFQSVKINFSAPLQQSNFKLGRSYRFLGEASGKLGLNVKKWSFSQVLSGEVFQVVPDTAEHPILKLFWQISTTP